MYSWGNYNLNVATPLRSDVNETCNHSFTGSTNGFTWFDGRDGGV